MNVKQLIKELRGYDPKMELIWSKDSEGNAFHSLSELGGTMYVLSDSLEEYDVEPVSEFEIEDDEGYCVDVEINDENKPDWATKVLCLN